MPTARFEPAIPASERPQTQALDRAATEIGPFSSTATLFSQDIRACLEAVDLTSEAKAAAKT
jgi:hypothetical protein